jgi:hypothetical protein
MSSSSIAAPAIRPAPPIRALGKAPRASRVFKPSAPTAVTAHCRVLLTVSTAVSVSASPSPRLLLVFLEILVACRGHARTPKVSTFGADSITPLFDMFDVLHLFEVLHPVPRTREGAKELGYRRDTSSVNGTFSLAASFQAVEAISLPGRGVTDRGLVVQSRFPPGLCQAVPAGWGSPWQTPSWRRSDRNDCWPS